MSQRNPFPLPAPRVMPWKGEEESEVLLSREWLVTNGLGGYASGTVSGAVTRRYHGLLIAALPAPLGRMVLWSHVSEQLIFGDGDVVSLGSEERAGGQLDLHGADHLSEFYLEAGLPVWRFTVRDLVLEKRVLLLHEQNTVHVSYAISGAGPRPRLVLRPAVNFRHYANAVDEIPEENYEFSAVEEHYELRHPNPALPPLRFCLPGAVARFTLDPRSIHEVIYRSELERGYDYEGDLWSPGVFEVDLTQHETVTVVGSCEEWENVDVLTPAEARAAELTRRERLIIQAAPAARSGFAAELVLAADQFIVTPAGRAQEDRTRVAVDRLAHTWQHFHRVS